MRAKGSMSVCIQQLAETRGADSCGWPGAHRGPEENHAPLLHVGLKITLNHHFGVTEYVSPGRAEVIAWDLLGLNRNRGLQKTCEASHTLYDFSSPIWVIFLFSMQKTDSGIFQNCFCFSADFRKLRMTFQTLKNMSKIMLSEEILEVS